MERFIQLDTSWGIRKLVSTDFLISVHPPVSVFQPLVHNVFSERLALRQQCAFLVCSPASGQNKHLNGQAIN